MDDKATDPEKDELRFMLMSRNEMIMEDISLVALDARSTGLHYRVRTVVNAAAKIAALISAARALTED